MNNNFKKILNELSYRVSSGIPDLSNEQHLIKLWDILKEHNWSIDARVELLRNLSNGITLPQVFLNEGKREEATLNTSMFETAALIGTTGISTTSLENLLQSPAIFKTIKLAKKQDVEEFGRQCKEIEKLSKAALDTLKKGLSSSGDWQGTGVKIIQSLESPRWVQKELQFYENGLQTIATCAALVIGMREYMDKVVSIGSVKFTHEQIATFYAAERSRGITRQGSKSNVADAILSNVDANTLISAVENPSNEIVGDPSAGTVKVGDKITYYQVSLKKSLQGAQLGKFKKRLRQVYDLGISVGDAADLLQEDYDELENLILTEGFLDTIKNFATKTFLAIKSKVNGALKSLKGMFFKNFVNNKPIPNSAVQSILKGYTIKEELQINDDILTEGKMSDNTKAIINEIYKNPRQAYGNINKELEKLSTQLGGLKEEAYSKIKSGLSLGRIPKHKNDKVPGSTAILSLIANMGTIQMLMDMTRKSKSLKAIVSDLVTEMLFGETQMPVWKVYGKFSSGDTAYKYLGTSKSIQKRLTSDEIKVQLLGVSVHPIKTHYVITCYLLSEITKDNKKYYAKIRTGTNSSSNMTYNFEGQSVIGPFTIDTNLQTAVA
jgi:hypothetical protein